MLIAVQGSNLQSDLRAVPRSAPAFRSNAAQEFHRSPAPCFVREDDAVFLRNSHRAVEIFIAYFNGIDPGRPSGKALRTTMDRMRIAYGGGTSPGYRTTEVNLRGDRSRAWILRHFGIEAMRSRGLPVQAALEVHDPRPVGIGSESQAVHVPLPGIPSGCWPTFTVEGRHEYPELNERVVRLFYRRMAEQLSQLVGKLAELEAGRVEDSCRGSHATHQARLKAGLETVVHFGRLAASFRQYRNGNWGLYGPMINEMVRRLGFNIEYPGFLDLILQRATADSLQRFFPVALAQRLPFFSDDGDNPLEMRCIEKRISRPAGSHR
jgi:hypothetical protein